MTSEALLWKHMDTDPSLLLSFSVLFQLNPDVNVFQRKFVNEVRRCEEMDRKLSTWVYINLSSAALG